jgi:hypothetical protein
MNLLDQLIAAARNGQSLSLPAAAELAPAAPATDPAYLAYCAEVDARNARKACCPRCHGRGHFPEYAHRNGGACFRCNGEAARPEPTATYTDWLDLRAAELGFDFPVYRAE